MGGVSDRADIKVGVRSIKGRWNSHTKSREVQVNGRRIFLKGGNWIASDALLRLSAKRYDAEVRLHHDMNLNLIRVWGGGLTERPEFYDACDKYGILVMQDFWVSGDCNGRWYDPYKKDDTLARRKYPDDHALFVATLADQICLLRNHASLAIWCGGNELKPPADILKKLRDSLLPKLDGTSIFFAYSNDDSMSLNSHDGPYDIQNPDSFFYRRSYPFNSEVGSVGLSDVASLRKIMPMKDLVPPYYNTKTCKWVTDSVWAYHKYKTYDSAIERYGHPSGIEAFCGKAQLVNYTQYRALMEGVAVHGWDWYTGVIEWKTQNPWPALLGQMYDPWLDPNGCWAGIKKGAEDLHVLFDPTDSAIVLVNRQAEEAARLQVSYQLLDMTGHRIAGSSRFATVKEGMNDTCFRLANLLKTDCPVKGCFMALRVVDSALGFPVDENLYWLADSGGTYSGLQEMPEANIRFGFKILEPGLAEVTLTNPEKNPVAFFNRISLVNPATLERILPTFFSDNYVSVLPGTTRTVLVTYDHDAALTPKACVEGWNVRRQYAKSR